MPCYSPITLRAKKGKATGDVVPCGRCLGCGLEYSRQWTVRLETELKFHDEAVFLTLTYDDQNIPINLKNGLTTLAPKDCQKFIKRLRQAIHPKKISFYLVGEYGDRTGRPHYHAIIFGYSFPDKTFHSYHNRHALYVSQFLNKKWTHGNCLIGEVTSASIAYVARYTLKKQRGRGAQRYIDLGIVPEFSRMSRNPAIGSTFYARYKSDIYSCDEFITNDGKKTRPPRYFDKLLEKTDPLYLSQLKQIRKLNASKNHEKNNKSRLKVKEQVKKAQIRDLKRRYL